MSVPRVSVLMTVYNAAPFLKESVDSLLAQTFEGWELIAIENGSSDSSLDILRGYRDPRIKIFPFPQNIGRTPALREAFDRAEGEYVAVLDADDIAHRERFAKEVAFLDAHAEAVLVGSWAELIDREGRVFKTWEFPTDPDELYDILGQRNPFVHSSVMFRRQAAVTVGGYPSRFVFAQDLALFLELAHFGKLAMIGEYLCRLRMMSTSMTHSARHRLDVLGEEVELLKKAGECLVLSPRAVSLNRQAIARREMRYGVALCSHGKVAEGLMRMVQGFFRRF